MAHNPWRDGRRAWERLEQWAARLRPGGSGDGDAELAALDDIGQVRHLLDQAELAAVRQARRNRRSWTEIATRLGITRQSAWERWRDVDDEVAGDATATPATASGAREDLPAVEAFVLERAAREMRRRGRVKVPSVVGLTYREALTVLARAELLADGVDHDGQPVAVDDMPGGVVVDQVPEAGAKIPAASAVRLWLTHGRGGGAGVREPRRPTPSPTTLIEMRPEPLDESVAETG